MMNLLHTSNPNTVAALERLMHEMQNLVDHPRIQQRTWVARAKEWLPLLQIVHGELTGQRQSAAADDGTPLTDRETASMLGEVSVAGGQTFINVPLATVAQVEVYRGGEPGYRYVRGAHSGFILKDGRKYLTSADEAQRLVDAMRKRAQAAGDESS
ncbi:MAG: hypothetical protein IPK19_25815 [Chloroflexi bacterium]|nr:hypothetical protein [Chloroflexota bacterium]